MRKISTKQDVDSLKGVPPPVLQRIEEIVALLDFHYGKSRNTDEELGGYVLLAENQSDVDNLKKTLLEGTNALLPECSDVILWHKEPVFTSSLFLLSSDFSVNLIIPYSLTPDTLLKYIQTGGE